MDNFGNPNCVEDFQAMIAEADAQIAGMSKRGQQLGMQISAQAREIARLNAIVSEHEAKAAEAEKATDPDPPADHASE